MKLSWTLEHVRTTDRGTHLFKQANGRINFYLPKNEILGDQQVPKTITLTVEDKK